MPRTRKRAAASEPKAALGNVAAEPPLAVVEDMASNPKRRKAAPKKAKQEGQPQAPASQKGRAKKQTAKEDGRPPQRKKIAKEEKDAEEPFDYDSVAPDETCKFIMQTLDHLYPEPPVPLNHKDTFTLLCAVMLSAQTTDGKVNEVGSPNISHLLKP